MEDTTFTTENPATDELITAEMPAAMPASTPSPKPLPLGMNSFNSKDRKEFGQNVRLAMSCIEQPPKSAPGMAIPSDEDSIRERLKALSQEITSQHADLLELLVRFDNVQGWKTGGASHCAAWMNFEIGISIQMSWEYLRVGRKLQSLPTVKALFRAGKLSWSKVRLITRVADIENEKTLCHAALDASVTDVKRICEGYRWANDNDGQDDKDNEDNEKAIQQWTSRSLTWNEASNGSTRIQLTLPPELAQAFLNSVEHSMNKLETNDENMPQRRADAAVLMAETSLQSAGKTISAADRYQVIVSVDESELSTTNAKNTSLKKRPTINNAGPIARETARRLSCDCSITVNKTANGEPVNIGRKSRIWPTAMERAIKQRDQHCVWPGCTQSRHLHIHHIKHWADGGETSIENAACLCSHHHTLVHEGGFTIQRVEDIHEQFNQQKNADDKTMFEFEAELRNDEESFKTVRSLSPSRYRFHVIRDKVEDEVKNKPTTKHDRDYTRIYSKHPKDDECREPTMPCYGARTKPLTTGNNYINFSVATKRASVELII